MIKHAVLYLVIVLFFSITVSAEEVENSKNVKQLIDKIKVAKVADKRILMNQLKMALRNSNKQHRIEAMRELQKSFSANPKGHAVVYNRKHKRHKSLQEKQATRQPKYRHKGKGKGQQKGKGRGKGNGKGKGKGNKWP